MEKPRILVTGGAGFIGSALVRYLLEETQAEVLNYDVLTYAANLMTLEDLSHHPRYRFVQGDICNKDKVEKTFSEFSPDYILHLAAESHVDRSLLGPQQFVETNVLGTAILLQEALHYWRGLSTIRQESFRFLHVSTDEVFGSLKNDGAFSETTPCDPSSPYSASKASADHMVRAWGHSFGLPVLITNCFNNYGPAQFPEKLIPLMILNALEGKPHDLDHGHRCGECQDEMAGESTGLVAKACGSNEVEEKDEERGSSPKPQPSRLGVGSGLGRFGPSLGRMLGEGNECDDTKLRAHGVDDGERLRVAKHAHRTQSALGDHKAKGPMR